MKRFSVGGIFLHLMVAVASLRASTPTVDQVVANAVAARGGIEAIHGMKSLRLAGTISFGSNASGAFKVLILRGGKMREEFTQNGKTMVRATIGKSGWKIDPFSGRAVVQPLSDEELNNMAGGADLEGPLMDYKEKGGQAELLGREKIRGKEAFKLKLTSRDGKVRNDFIDCDSFLEVKWEGKLNLDGKAFDVETFFSDFRKVDGIVFPFSSDSNTLGTPIKQKIVFERVEVNPSLDESVFSPALFADEFPHGKVITKVPCAKAPTFSYALYLPKSMPPGGPAPLLLLFDPGGDGLGAVHRFEEAAEATGTAVAGSLDSRNGFTWERYGQILAAIWDDLSVRFPGGPRFVGGFSGGARIALGMTLLHPKEIQGLFSAGAFFDVGTQLPPQGLALFLVCGDQDFNLTEMRDAHLKLQREGFPHRWVNFSGDHRWPPKDRCLEGLAYLRQAVSAPISTAF